MIIGVAMVRNEIDVIEGVVRHMAAELDHLIVADNGSTDGTRNVLDKLAQTLPLTVSDDPEVGYYQSRKMTDLAGQAGRNGATWVVPFDADELWTAPGRRVADELATVDGDVVAAEVFNHYCTALDRQDTDPFEAMVWRSTTPLPLPKVAFRWRTGAVVEQGNHGVVLPGHAVRAGVRLQVRHFPYRSAGQFVSKARQGSAAYAATDLPDYMGAHWRMYGRALDEHGEQAMHDWFRQHFWHVAPRLSGLVKDPADYRRWENR